MPPLIFYANVIVVDMVVGKLSAHTALKELTLRTIVRRNQPVFN